MNPARGEAQIRVEGAAVTIRPSFAALVAAEQELGPLFALVERAAEGQLRLSEVAALFWHCSGQADLTREQVGAAIVGQGLAATTPALAVLIGQILKGR